MKKILSLVLCLCLLVSACFALIGCGKPFNSGALHVAITSSGVGTAWLDEYERIYEERNPGVDIVVEEYDPSKLTSGTLKRTLKDKKDGAALIDVVYSNAITMNDLVDNVETGTQMVDITDIVTEGGENSIYSKMHDTVKTGMANYGTVESPKFYGLPYFSSHYGMVYDRDMFTHYNLFSLAGYKGLDCIDGNDDDGYGADGLPDTYDDGLPATWEDFKILLDVLVEKGITGFAYSAKETGYQTRWLSSIWASYEGANNYGLLTSLNGTWYKQDGTTVEINPTNAWQLTQMNGKYAAIKVAEYLIKHSRSNGFSNYVSDKTGSTTFSASSAQTVFVQSWPRSFVKSDQKPIAFLLEGSWWENEANENDVFDKCVDDYENDDYDWAYGERNFAYFPFPKFIGSSDIPDQTNTMTTLGDDVGNTTAVAFINSHSDKIDLAKDFLKFCFSDEMNALFTQTSGVGRQYRYTLTDDQKDSLTPYQLSLWNLLQGDTSTIESVSGRSNSEIYYYKGAFVNDAFGFATRIPGVGSGTSAGEKLTSPLRAFHDYADNPLMTAENYFNNAVAGSAIAGEDKINANYWYDTLKDYID